jgi:hypothetical protein
VSIIHWFSGNVQCDWIATSMESALRVSRGVIGVSRQYDYNDINMREVLRINQLIRQNKKDNGWTTDLGPLLCRPTISYYDVQPVC